MNAFLPLIYTCVNFGSCCCVLSASALYTFLFNVTCLSVSYMFGKYTPILRRILRAHSYMKLKPLACVLYSMM